MKILFRKFSGKFLLVFVVVMATQLSFSQTTVTKKTGNKTTAVVSTPVKKSSDPAKQIVTANSNLPDSDKVIDLNTRNAVDPLNVRRPLPANNTESTEKNNAQQKNAVDPKALPKK